MDIIWQVLVWIGAFILVLLGVAVLVVCLFFKKIKRLAMEIAGAPGPPPRIHLKSIETASWADRSKFEESREFVLSNGFTEIGAFSVTEMPALSLHAFMKPEGEQICIFYEQEPLGFWADFVCYFDNETSLTVSNAPIGGQLEQHPDHQKVHAKGKALSEILALLVEKSENRKPKRLDTSISGFIELFEKAYNDELDWRNSKGGPSEEEIRAIARESNIEVNDEVVEIQRLLSAFEACKGLSIALSEKYRGTRGISEVEWEAQEDTTVFVHDKIPGDLLRETLEKHLEGNFFRYESMIDRLLDSQPPREAFTAINEALAPEDRFDAVTVLAEPVAADVYRSPLLRKSRER